MKRWLRIRMVLLLTAVLISTLPCAASAKTVDSGLILTEEVASPLRNVVTAVSEVEGGDVTAALSSDSPPTVLLVNSKTLDDVATFLTACMDGGVIPMLQIDNTDEVNRVVVAVTDTKCKDLSVISADTEVLKLVRNRKILLRTGLILTLESDTLTSQEAHVVRQAVRGAPATFCVVDSAYASKQLVTELQELCMAVWVRVADQEEPRLWDIEAVRAVTSGANAVITSDAAAFRALVDATFAENTMTRLPIMIGHRGNPSQAPENSLTGFLTAFDNGADIFEIDVEITKDGEIIIMHDDTLNRTTNYTGDKRIGDMTLQEIKEYRLLALDGTVSDETVPTLREVLEAFKELDCRIFVEFKGYNENNVKATADIIKEYGMEDRVNVISFNTDLITMTQKELDGMSTGFLHAPSALTPTQATALEALFPSITQAQTYNSTINPSSGVVSRSYFEAANARGLTVWPWTYTEGSNTKAFLLAPNGITTDDVQWARDLPKELTATAEQKSIAIDKQWELDVHTVSYGRAEEYVGAVDRIVTVIDGEDCITVDEGTIRGVKSGEATVIVGYKTTLPSGAEYVLYSQPITVKVINVTLIVSLVVGGIVLSAIVVVVIVLLRKRKVGIPVEEESA